jgi:hypothetical protein
MTHIRNVSGGRSVASHDSVALAVMPVTPLQDLLADLYAAFTQVVYRKKFEPLPG